MNTPSLEEILKQQKYFEKHIIHKIKNEVLGVEVIKTRLYSIEDSQQRTADLREVNDSFFKSEEEKKSFWDYEVPVFINYNCTIMKLVRLFTRINDGTTLSIEDKLWGYPTNINDGLKELAIKKDWADRLSNKHRKDEVERNIYKNLKKIMIVCGSHDNIHNINTTAAKDIRSFTENEDLDINQYDNIINCFNDAVFFLEEIKKDKDKFANQAKITFIIHILKKRDQNITIYLVKEVLSIVTDTRKKSEYWYREIYDYLTKKIL